MDRKVEIHEQCREMVDFGCAITTNDPLQKYYELPATSITGNEAPCVSEP